MNGLKQLRLNKQLQIKRSKLDELSNKDAELKKRSEELAVTLEEAQTEEDVQLVTEEIEKLEAEQKENDESKELVEKEIEEIEGELQDIEERSAKPILHSTRSKGAKGMNKLQVRELLKTGEYYERSEVKEFYEQFKNLRGVAGGELTIPEIVVNRIMDIVGDYTTVYPLVEKMQVKGTARILLDTDTDEAQWMEMYSSIPEGDVGTITKLDFDGFKVGKITFVDNALLHDSIINLDQYVVKKIARAIGKALDLAILHGKGQNDKQPVGIITELSQPTNTSRVITVANPTGYGEIVKPIALIDNGKDSSGTIIALMSRATYYNRCMPFTVQTNSAGAIVGKLPNLSNPDMLGLRVVFSNYMKDDEILFGDFSKYTLVERENIVVENSTHFRFQQDQTAFRGKGRFDGKPTDIEGFVLIKLTGQSNFISPNTVPTPGTYTNGSVVTPGGGSQDTPTTTLRVVTTNDLSKPTESASFTVSANAAGTISANKNHTAFTAGQEKSVVFLPNGVTEMTFKATKDQHWLVIGADENKQNVLLAGIGASQYNLANASVAVSGGLGKIRGLTKASLGTNANAHTYAQGAEYKVINNADSYEVHYKDGNEFKQWYRFAKTALAANLGTSSGQNLDWYNPILGAAAGISENDRTNTIYLEEVKIVPTA